MSKIDTSNFVFFPLRHNQKVPAIKKWGNLSQTKERWQFNQNLALICGDLSGITVFDIDSYKFEDYDKHPFIQKFGKKFWKTFNTYTVKTAKGGYHLYFKYDYDIQTTTNDELQIDIRNDGSYIVAPPSSINGSKYECIHNKSIKKFPKELKEFYETVMCHSRSGKPSKPKNRVSKINHNDSNESLLRYVLESNDWKTILNRLDSKYLNEIKYWYKATLASKYLGFKQEWEEWSKQSSKYNEDQNETIWNSINYFNEEALKIIIRRIICNENCSPKFVLEDKYADKCFYKPLNECLEGFKEINKPKIDNIFGNVRFFNKTKNYLLKSDTGTGKTTAFVHYIKEQKAPFISIAPRICLGAEQYELFTKEHNIDCQFYQAKDFEYGRSLVITPESLHYIVNYDFKRYIIFLDEVNSMIEQLITSSTMDSNRILILSIIVKMLRTCKQFIAVDADVSKTTIKLLKSVGVEYKFIKNIYQHFKGVNVCFQKDENIFYEMIKKESKYMLACDSKETAMRYHKRLTKEGQKDILLLVSEEHEEKKDTIGNYQHINLDDHEKVIFSPKVVYGLDSKMKRPMYGIYKSHTISPPQMVQQIARCRNIDYVNIFFEDIQSCYPKYASIKNVKATLKLEMNAHQQQYYELEKYERECREEDGEDVECWDDLEEDDIATKAMSETLIKIYKPLAMRCEYVNDVYSTNKYLHMKNIMNERGFKVDDKSFTIPVMIDKKIKKELSKEILSDKIERFDVEDEHIKRRLEILSIPEKDINDELKEFLIDNFTLQKYFNYAHFKRKNKNDLLNELKARKDFNDKKYRSNKNKLVLIYEFLEKLGLSKFDINMKRTGSKVEGMEEIKKQYHLMTKDSKRKFETDVDFHNALIELYRSMFGIVRKKQKAYKKGEIRQVKIDFEAKKALFDKVYDYQYKQYDDVFYDETSRLDSN